MSKSENTIECLANIKKVTSKTLVSGDKETRIELSIVGPDTANANRFSDVPPEALVKLKYDVDESYND